MSNLCPSSDVPAGKNKELHLNLIQPNVMMVQKQHRCGWDRPWVLRSTPGKVTGAPQAPHGSVAGWHPATHRVGGVALPSSR